MSLRAGIVSRTYAIICVGLVWILIGMISCGRDTRQVPTLTTFHNTRDSYHLEYPRSWERDCCTNVEDGSLLSLFPPNSLQDSERSFRVDLYGWILRGSLADYIDEWAPTRVPDASVQQHRMRIAQRPATIVDVRYAPTPPPDAGEYCACVIRTYVIDRDPGRVLRVEVRALDPQQWDQWIGIAEKIVASLRFEG